MVWTPMNMYTYLQSLQLIILAIRLFKDDRTASTTYTTSHRL